MSKVTQYLIAEPDMTAHALKDAIADGLTAIDTDMGKFDAKLAFIMQVPIERAEIIEEAMRRIGIHFDLVPKGTR